MASLKETIEAKRSQLFVGRHHEIAFLNAWLQNQEAPTQIISIQGIPGIGKSTLLIEMLRIASKKGALTLWLDGRACARSPGGFLDDVGTMLVQSAKSSEKIVQSRNIIHGICEIISTGILFLLALDNFDDLSMLEGWFREDFCGRLPDRGMLILLASRSGLSPAWKADPAWCQRLHQWTLSPFTHQESRKYLENLNIYGKSAELLIHEAAGHPLALALGAEFLGRHSGEVSTGVSHIISAHLLREVTSSNLHPLLEVLAVVREADQELIAQVLGETVTANDYHALSELSFISFSDHGLSLHDVARLHLRNDLRNRAPRRFQFLRRRALVALRDRLTVARERHERRRISTLLLALCQDALPVYPSVADLTLISDLPAPTPPRPEERPLLHAFLEAWMVKMMKLTDLKDEHCLLDILFDRFPESIWVGRTEEGEPFGFMAVVLLWRETAALLERYRAGAVYLKQCPQEERCFLDCSPEMADTCFIVLGGLDEKWIDQSLEEVVGSAFHECLSLLGEKTRLLVVASNPELHAFMEQLGFRRRPACWGMFGDAPWPFQVMELDLRACDFGEWVTTFLDKIEGGRSEAHAPLSLVRMNGYWDQPLDIIMKELRYALSNIHHLVRLHNSNLATWMKMDGKALQLFLCDLLTRNDPPPPLTEEDQNILKITYIDRKRNSEYVTAQLYISRATYYRRLRGALANLAEVLCADFRS